MESISVSSSTQSRAAYAFKFWISEHAVERFRERVGEDLRSRQEWELARLLDERIRAAKLVTVVDTDAPDVDTTLAAIESRAGTTCFVVLRPYKPDSYPRSRIAGGPAGAALIAVTVLTSEMASNNYAKGQWRVPNRPLANKLAGVIVSAPEQQLAPKAKPIKPIAASPKINGLKMKRGGTVERHEFVKRILRERPHIKTHGKDGMCELVKAEFGSGMSAEVIARLRIQVEAEGPTSIVAQTATSRMTHKAPAIDRITAKAVELSGRLGFAIDDERNAKAKFADVLAAYQLAERELQEASAKVESLMAEFQASRLG